jgi:hypothetical protein
MDRDEILSAGRGRDDEEAKTYFRMKDLKRTWCATTSRASLHPKMAQRLRDLGGEPISLFLKNRAARCWRIPRFNRQDAPFETPEQRTQRSPF